MAEITKTTPGPVPKYVWISLAVLALITLFSGLGIPFVGPDEPRYAQVAREMYEAGDLVTPTLGGFPWFEKPPLLYWLEIVSYHLFGVSEVAARLGPALCGLGTIFSLWLLGYNTLSQRQMARTTFAHLIALVAASTLSIIVFAHGASFDIVVTFTMTGALVSFFVFDNTSHQRRFSLPLVLFYLFVGLSLLAKGLIGIVFPFAIVALYYLVSRRLPDRHFVISLVWGTVLAVAIACIWYVPMYLQHGWTFVDEFLIQHHFARFTSNKYKHPQPFYFFFWVLPLMLLPWTPLFLAAIWKSGREAINGLRSNDRGGRPIAPFGVSPLLAFSVCWLVVPLVFFSFSGSKLPGYILPAVPAGIVITAIYLLRLATRSRLWMYAATGIAASVFVAVITGSLTIAPRLADAESTKGLILAAAERGYASERIYGLHTVSHNAEFYGAGRLIREPGGVQKRFYDTSEVKTDMQRTGINNALVLVPIADARQLEGMTTLKTELIRDNGELAIFAVSIP